MNSPESFITVPELLTISGNSGYLSGVNSYEGDGPPSPLRMTLTFQDVVLQGNNNQELLKGQISISSMAEVRPETLMILARLLNSYRGGFSINVMGTYKLYSGFAVVEGIIRGAMINRF